MITSRIVRQGKLVIWHPKACLRVRKCNKHVHKIPTEHSACIAAHNTVLIRRHSWLLAMNNAADVNVSVKKFISGRPRQPKIRQKHMTLPRTHVENEKHHERWLTCCRRGAWRESLVVLWTAIAISMLARGGDLGSKLSQLREWRNKPIIWGGRWPN